MDLSTLICWWLFSIACYFLAEYKNRDTTLWSLLGILFTVFAFVWLLLLPKLPKEGVDSVVNK